MEVMGKKYLYHGGSLKNPIFKGGPFLPEPPQKIINPSDPCPIYEHPPPNFGELDFPLEMHPCSKKAKTHFLK